MAKFCEINFSTYFLRQNTTPRKLCIRHLLNVSAIIRYHQADFATKYTQKAHPAEGLFFTVNTLKYIILYIIPYKGKGKVIPLRTWTGPEGSRGLRLPDFKTIST
jgi:hypothetical protein